VEYTSWRWVFWFVACVALPIGVAAWVLAPPSVRQDAKASLTTKEKIKNLDLPGVSILTSESSKYIVYCQDTKGLFSCIDSPRVRCYLWHHCWMVVSTSPSTTDHLSLYDCWLLLLRNNNPYRDCISVRTLQQEAFHDHSH
jgi:hypothetical protein